MTVEQAPADSLQLSDYVRVIGRRRWIVVGGAVVGALLAWLFVLYTGPEYESTASVLVNPVNINPETATARPDQLVNLPTERERIHSAAITQRAAAIMGYEGTPTSLLDRLTVIIPESTQILEITFTAKRPEVAQEGAQAFADAYLEHRGEQARLAVDTRRDRIAEEIAEVSEDLIEANQRLVDSEEGTLANALAEADIQLLNSRMRDLQQDLAETELLSVQPGEVIVPAQTPGGPATQPTWLVILVGALAGAVFSLPVAFGREHLDDRIRDSSDLAELGIGPVLGTITLSAHRHGDHLRLQEDPSESGPYRKLSLNVMSSLSLSGGKRLAVTGVGVAEDEPEIVVQLAIATAAMRYPVLLMESDPHTELDTYLPVEREPRLKDVILGEKAFGQVVQIVEELPDLRVVTGGIPRDIRVPWDRLTELIQQLPSSTDYLMMHTAPAVESVDTLRICALMDGVVLLVKRDRTTRDAVIQAARQLEQGGAKISGAVLISGHARHRRSPAGADPQGAAGDLA